MYQTSHKWNENIFKVEGALQHEDIFPLVFYFWSLQRGKIPDLSQVDISCYQVHKIQPITKRHVLLLGLLSLLRNQQKFTKCHAKINHTSAHESDDISSPACVSDDICNPTHVSDDISSLARVSNDICNPTRVSDDISGPIKL